MRLTGSEGAGPLHGIVVVELAGDVATAYVGRLFSVLGARVLRAGEPRGLGASTGDLAFGRWLDEGKVVCASVEVALEAARAPDVLVCGQSPAEVVAADAMVAARGLDVLRTGLTWFGQEGPLRDWLGDDALVQSLIGIVAGFGPPEGVPVIPQGHAPQMIAGALTFAATLGALFARRGGGSVSRVDADVLEAALCFTEVGPPNLDGVTARAPRNTVNRFAANHPMSVYRTADGWLGVTALTPTQWSSLTELVGLPGWGTDAQFATSLARVARADQIDEALIPIFRTRPTEAWLIEGQKRRIPLAPVPRPSQLPSTPHWSQRGSFEAFGAGDDVVGPSLPFSMRFDGQAQSVPPARGGAPLAGLRVADFSMGWAGPLCTRILADLGADVVKVESATHYDWWRGWEPPGASDPPEYELKMVFAVMNRGKRGVALDLTEPEGRDAAKALVAGADIVIENYAPGVMEKLGLGREVLQSLRPGLVMVSMGAFGAVGPWSFFRAYGATVEQASGMPHVNGHDSWPPSLQHGAYGDPVAGVYAAVAALAGLHGRDTLGGVWADLAQVECLFQLAADAIIASQVEGDPPRLGSRNRHIAPRCVVETADPDEPLAVVANNEQTWRALCGVLGRPQWSDDPAMLSPEGRNAHAEEIEAAIADWARGMDAEIAAARLQAAGVPAAPVLSSLRLAGHVQATARGTWMRIERPHLGRHLMAAPAFRIDGVRPAVARPAPLLGEHTQEVLEALASASPGEA